MTRVAVSATLRHFDGVDRLALNIAYVNAVAGAGLTPVVVPPHLAPARVGEVLDVVAGLVLTGGEDVDPANYRAAPHPNLKRIDPARDALELALFHEARRRRLPTLAICRGLQLVNVALGGTLYQDLPAERPGPIDHGDEQRNHALLTVPGTLLARTLSSLQAVVNSRHHQAIRDLAPGLRICATAPDGVIEGVEPADPAAPWLLAVQWHPEDMTERELFQGFARAVA